MSYAVLPFSPFPPSLRPSSHSTTSFHPNACPAPPWREPYLKSSAQMKSVGEIRSEIRLLMISSAFRRSSEMTDFSWRGVAYTTVCEPHRVSPVEGESGQAASKQHAACQRLSLRPGIPKSSVRQFVLSHAVLLENPPGASGSSAARTPPSGSPRSRRTRPSTVVR